MNATAENKVYWRESFYILLLGLTFFLLLAVITYDPLDQTSFSFSSQNHLLPINTEGKTEFSNSLGPIGAQLADWGFELFGMGALLFPWIFFLQTFVLFLKPAPKSRLALRALGYPQFLLSLLGMMHVILPQWHFRGLTIESGGLIGSQLYHLFFPYFGEEGTLILFIFGCLVSLPLCLGIRPLSIVIFLFEKLPFRKAKTIADSFEEKAVKTTVKKSKQMDKNKATVTESMVEDQLLECLARSEVTTALTQERQNELKEEGKLIEESFGHYGVTGSITKSLAGPVLNVHQFEPTPGVKVNKILGLQDDLSLNLKAESVLIALRPGTSTVGIEIPSKHREVVHLRDVMSHDNFQNSNSPLPMALGKTVDGSPLIADLSDMPHLLVAGATGSGKSVCINVILLSLMIHCKPEEMRLILVDPKMLELSQYEDLGHLLMPVVTEPVKAASALQWALREMDRRYLLMKDAGCRNIRSYNSYAKENHLSSVPYIVIVIDELCDLMMMAPQDVEDSVQRLAQKARAAGIHLILATQRPSVDVLTGVIKANLPCRISFQVASRHDSRTIIEAMGAERLLGKGDMLFLPPGSSRLIRGQCALVKDDEVQKLVGKMKSIYPANYSQEAIDYIEQQSSLMRQKSDKRLQKNQYLIRQEPEKMEE